MNNNYLNIRYVKLHFKITMTEQTKLPIYKASALRGGMGEMMLRSHCIRDRKCDDCDFKTECLVQRVMYSQMEIQPKFMTSGDSVGYVLECEDYREEFYEGDDLKFNLVLFGKTIVYFSQFLDAFFRLGMMGIGKNKSKFSIVSVTNSKGKEILRGNNVVMSEYKVLTVNDYIQYRMSQIRSKDEICLVFQTPLSLKYQGEMILEFAWDAIIKSISRRIYMLDCFEGIENEQNISELENDILIMHEEHRNVSVPRYSNRQQSKMVFRGIEGELKVSGVSDELLQVILAGELLHIGKNTSFGFGRYRVK